MILPFDLKDILGASSRIRGESDAPVRLAVFVEVDAPDELTDALQSRLVPQTAAARIHVDVVEPGTRLGVASTVDAVIALVGSGSVDLAGSLADVRESGVPALALALAPDDHRVARALGHPVLDTKTAGEPLELFDRRLGAWLVDRLGHKRLALARNFAFMRKAVAIEAAKNTATQNAVIGGITIFPGADLPLMTANQIKMVLQIAAAYGADLGAQRVRELAVVVGGGFAMRSIARQIVGVVPGFGWAIKGSIGYTGTMAMGLAAIEYFEQGADLGEVARHLAEVGRGVAAKVPALRGEGAGES